MSHKLRETLLVVLQHVMVEQCLMSIKIPMSSALTLTLQERFPKDRELQLLPILAQRFLICPERCSGTYGGALALPEGSECLQILLKVLVGKRVSGSNYRTNAQRDVILKNGLLRVTSAQFKH